MHIFFDLLRISSNIKAAQISLHRLRRLILKVYILSFRLLRLPFDFGTLHHNRRTDPVFFGDALDVAIVNFHKVPTI